MINKFLYLVIIPDNVQQFLLPYKFGYFAYNLWYIQHIYKKGLIEQHTQELGTFDNFTVPIKRKLLNYDLSHGSLWKFIAHRDTTKIIYMENGLKEVLLLCYSIKTSMIIKQDIKRYAKRCYASPSFIFFVSLCTLLSFLLTENDCYNRTDTLNIYYLFCELLKVKIYFK